MSINTQLVTVSVDNIVAGVPEGTPSDVQCVMALGDYVQTRNKIAYFCMSSNDSTVGLGSIARDPLTFELLYNEDTADGQEKLKEAFKNNTELQVEIEFANSITTNGTTIAAPMGVSIFSMPMPKDGKVGANFTLEFMGAATLTPAA